MSAIKFLTNRASYSKLAIIELSPFQNDFSVITFFTNLTTLGIFTEQHQKPFRQKPLAKFVLKKLDTNHIVTEWHISDMYKI